MTRFVGFTELVYGADYLEVALRSVVPYVDAYFIAYSDKPLNRHNPYKCPDTRAEMKALAERVCAEFDKPLTWYDNPGSWGRYDQRNSIFTKAPEADVVVLTDADEVWQPGAVTALAEAVRSGTTRYYRVPMRFFWRSFDHVCYQRNGAALPLRAFKPSIQGPRNGEPSTAVMDLPWLNEFGFARAPRDFLYKMPSHGHFAKRLHWFKNVWLPWTPEHGQMEDVYPNNPEFGGMSRFPKVEKFDKMELPEFMREHKYFDEAVIGGNEWPNLERL